MKVRNLLIGLVVWLLPCISFAQYRNYQNSEVDSLKQILTTGTIENKMSACNDLAKHYSESNIGLSRYYAQELLRMSLQAKNKQREGDAYRSIMNVVYVTSLDSSVIYADKAMKAYVEAKNDTMAVFVKINKGILLGKLFRNDEALETMLECLDFYTKNRMEYRRATTIQSIGAMYGDMQLHDLANEYYAQALSVYETLPKNDDVLRNMGFCYMFAGENYFQTNNLQKALEYRIKSLEVFRQINHNFFTTYALLYVSTSYLGLRKKEEALRYLKEAEAMMENMDNDILHSEVLRLRAEFHALNEEYKLALDYSKQALALMDTTAKREVYILYQQLATLSAFAGTPQETQAYITKFSRVVTEAINEEWSIKLTEMQTKYETEKKEHEIERQRNIISQQNMQRSLLVAGVIVCIVLLALLWYMLRLRNRRNLALTDRNDILAEMNATKDKFFNIISHDMKNPAIAQRDALQRLVKNACRWDANTLSDYHAGLLKSAEGQVELIYHLLNWSQLQTGRITCTPDTFNFSVRIRSDIALIRSMAEKKGITLTVSIPDDTLITGDKNMLGTVVRNLLTNAVKFTASGGRVSLDVSLRRDGACPVSNPAGDQYKDGARPVSTCIVSVSDTGVGMSEEQISNLFRLDRSHHREGTAGEQGSGLGLIVCREMLEKHGSELHVESEVGKGSRFWFEV